MANDFGLRVSPRVLHGPLWRVSAGALRLWVLLAVKAQHRAQTLSVMDGQRIKVGYGRWLTSFRRLRKDAGYSSMTILVKHIHELERAQAITRRSIQRTRSTNKAAVGAESGTPCTSFENASRSVATLITVLGINKIAQGAFHRSERKEMPATPSPLSQKDRDEISNVDRQLAAEGR